MKYPGYGSRRSCIEIHEKRDKKGKEVDDLPLEQEEEKIELYLGTRRPLGHGTLCGDGCHAPAALPPVQPGRSGKQPEPFHRVDVRLASDHLPLLVHLLQGVEAQELLPQSPWVPSRKDPHTIFMNVITFDGEVDQILIENFPEQHIFLHFFEVAARRCMQEKAPKARSSRGVS